jgi:MFS family permease
VQLYRMESFRPREVTMLPTSTLLATGGSFVPNLFPQTEGVLYALLLLLLALALMFAGRSIIKALAFLVVGLAGAVFGIAAGGLVFGLIGSVAGGIVGFILGGLIGLLLVQVGIGIALGYFGYLVVRDVTHVFILAIVVGVILFVVGVVVASKLLEAASAFLGGVILYGVLVFFGLGADLAFILSLIVAVLGFFVQHQSSSKRIIQGHAQTAG